MAGRLLAERELDVAQFAYDLSLGAVHEVFLLRHAELVERWSRTLWWRWRRRRLIDREDEMIVRLMMVAGRYYRQQKGEI